MQTERYPRTEGEVKKRTVRCDCESIACAPYHVAAGCRGEATACLIAFGYTTRRCPSCADNLRSTGAVTSDSPLASAGGAG